MNESLVIKVSSTRISFPCTQYGCLPDGTNITYFLRKNLTEYDYVPNQGNTITHIYAINNRYYTILPRYALDSLCEYLNNKSTDYRIVNERYIEPEHVEMSIKSTYQPRNNQAEMIEFLTNPSTNFKPLSAQTGIGKCGLNSDEVLTTEGWKRYDELKVGMLIQRPRGGYAQISGVFPQGKVEVWRVYFEDDRYLDVGIDHLWEVNVTINKTETEWIGKILSTVDLVHLLNDKDVTITIPTVTLFPKQNPSYDDYYDQYCDDIKRCHALSLGKDMYYANINNETKYDRRLIYNEFTQFDTYLCTDILSCLLDEDIINYRDNLYMWGTYVIEIAIDVRYMLWALGATAWIEEKINYNPIDKNSSTYYEVYFRINNDVFWEANNPVYENRLRIVDIVPLPEPQNCTCIYVNSDDHLYVTKNFIVTHNTFISISAATILQHPTLIILGRLIEQWYDNILEYTDVTKDDIYVVKGFPTLSNLWKMVDNGFRPKFIIFSTRTLYQYAVEPKEAYCTLPNYKKLQEKLGIGVLIHDETHLDFYANTCIDMCSNIKHNIFLSATYMRSDFYGRKIFDLVFPPTLRFGDQFTTKYTIAHIGRYHLDIPYYEHRRFRVVKGYLHSLYEKYLLTHKTYLRYFKQSVIKPLVEKFYLEKKKDGQRLLIICQTKEFTIELTNYLIENSCKLSISAYFSGDSTYGNQSILTSDIIVSTIKSSATGIDIKNLKTCINTVSYKSEPQTAQSFGRLRKLPNEVTIYVDIFNWEIESQKYHIGYRRSVYKQKALEVNDFIIN